jgi:opacity protein-like surface antigen
MKKILFLLLALFVMSGAVLAASKAEIKWMKKGQELYSKKDFAKAAEAFEKVLAENPNNISAMTYAGYSYMYAGGKAAALEKLEAAYEKSGDAKLKTYIEKLKGNDGEKDEAGDKGKVKVNGMNAGGAARVAALGGAGIVLPDYASQTDLYSSGFTAAYPYRKSRSVIHIVPYLNLYGNKTVADDANETTLENSVTGFGAGAAARAQSIAALNFMDNVCLIIKPRFEMNPGTRTTSYPAGTIVPFLRDAGLNILGGDFEAANIISGKLSLGITIGYDSTGVMAVDKNQPKNKETLDMSKTSIAGSAALLLSAGDGDLSIALSGGTKTSAQPYAPFAIRGIDPGFDLEYAKLAGRYGVKSMQSAYVAAFYIGPIKITPPYSQVINEETRTEGLSFGLGLDYRMENVLELDLTGELSPGITVKRTKGQTWTDLDTGTVVDNFLLNTWSNNEYDNYKDGLSVSTGLKARYYLQELLVIGAACSFMDLSITRIPRNNDSTTLGNPVTENLMFIDASAGVTVKIGKAFNIPLEGFYQSGARNEKDPAAETDENWNTGIFGARAGVEYMVTDELSARLGFDYAAGGTAHKLVTSGSVTVDEPAGTSDNPGKSNIGIGLGAGYKTGALDIGVSGRYVINGESPLENNYISKSGAGLELTASVLIGF